MALKIVKQIKGFNSEIITGTLSLQRFLRYTDVKMRSLVPSLAFSLIANGLNFYVFSQLLFPLSRGLINYDFNFIKNAVVVKPLIKFFPDLFASQISLLLLALLATYTLLIFKNFFTYLSSLFITNVSTTVSSRLRKLMSRRYLCFGKAYFDNTPPSRISLDIIHFANSVSGQLGAFNSMIFQLIQALAVFIIMFKASGYLTVLALAAAPIVTYSIHMITKNISQSSRKYTGAQANLSQSIMNIVSNIPTVKSYGREDAEARQFATISDDEIATATQINKRMQLVSPVEDTIVSTAIIVISAAVGFLIPKGIGLKVASAFIFLMLARMFINSFGALFKYSLSISQNKGQVDSIEAIFDDKDKYIIESGDKDFKGLQRSIEIRNLTFSYAAKNEIVKDASFIIEKGKTTAIVGSTGSGKTTFINLIARFYDCPPGMIFIDGIDIREYKLSSLMPRIAIVSQETLLFNDTIRNNISYGAENVSDEALIELLKRLNFYKFVMSNPKKLDMVVGERGVKLSGGQKQLLSIARALIKGFDILILDEATSYLDMKTENMALKVIEEYARGKTVIVIAHRLSSVRSADKVVVVEDGRIIEDGSISDLISRKGVFYEYTEAHQISW